jgi:multiple sugar transport system ATP-binding protein
MARVVFHHISKKYTGENRKSVDDFHLEVNDGEFLVLVGPSGCGKSTLLRMLAGLEEITEGEVYIGSKLVNYISSKDRNISMVFQNYALYPHMTVFENIAFGLRLRKLPHHIIEERVSKAAKILEIEAQLQKQPRQMSGGQRQRVALGRAIVREPDVFLMDEPLSNLDAKLRVQMREEIGKLHRRLKTTTIYVTHDQIEAMTMGTRIVVMKNGIIQQVDTPDEIYNNPANMFVASFIGTPPMNFIRGQIRHVDGAAYFETKRYSIVIPKEKAKKLFDLQYEQKRIIMGVRAESILTLNDEQMKQEQYKDVQFTSRIEMRELLGSDAYLYLNNEEHKLIVRVDPRARFAEGDQVNLAFDMDRVHFFDLQTEVALC